MPTPIAAQDRAPAGVIVSALWLAAERVTGDDLAQKERTRHALRDAATRIHQRLDGIAEGPSATELRGLLGDPDDEDLRKALAWWEEEAQA